MKCTVTLYLEQQELDCRRIAHSSNDGTKDQREWLKTAEGLLQRRKEHVAGCKECAKAQLSGGV